MNKKEKFRDQLLSQDKTNLDYQKTFQLEAKKMYTEKLKMSQRFGYVFASLIIAFFTLVFWAMSIAFEELQITQELSWVEPIRLASTWVMYFGVALTVLCLWPVIWGKVELRFYPKIVRFVFWILIFMITMLVGSVLEVIDIEGGANPALLAWIFTLMTLSILVGVYIILSGRIDRGDLKNKAKTLELEYRIAELEEKLNPSE